VGEDTNQIERQIAAERSDLGRNLHELEDKAKALTDWRTHYRNHTAIALGVAFGGGLLMGALTSGSRNGAAAEDVSETAGELPYDLPPPKRRSGFRTLSTAATSSQVGQHVKRQVDDVWRMIVDALVGVGAAKAVDLIGRNVPGFREQFDRRTGGSSSY
jgi:hypothetical protein